MGNEGMFGANLVLLFFIIGVNSQSYTFPIVQPNFGSVYQQDNSIYQQRFPYIPQNRYQFNPVAGIRVQQHDAPNRMRFSGSLPMNPNEYQVDQKPPQGPTRIIPPFLKTASQTQQDKFYAIVQHPVWTGAEKNAKIEELMREMSTENQDSFSTWKRETRGDVEAKRRKVDEAVSGMSKDAFDQFQKVVSIMRDPSITEGARLSKIEEIYSKLPESVKKEFDAKFQGL
ncbi:unnamed protein product [Caenorhabditis bovis]|uniref:SXP/RAL-2 family protein Ani s 5-like cation-binding domain-containing protein n=1 Tax=Caenorhabditis bovis TaxID=2654633 RepID=A0A8S1ERK3_9PELO|nr:unnamed protein product [Caenorhabditis bovis]